MHLKGAPTSQELFRHLYDSGDKLNLHDAYIYYRFPIYRGMDDSLIETDILLLSPYHGCVIFRCVEPSLRNSHSALKDAESTIDQLYSCIFSRLIRNRNLQKDRSTLLFPIHTAIYDPFLRHEDIDDEIISAVRSDILRSPGELDKFLLTNSREPLSANIFNELMLTH